MKEGFDFLIGSWRIRNRYLRERLSGCDEWIEFDATSVVQRLLGGIGNLDSFRAVRDGKTIEGMTLRLLNPATGEWSLYWADTVRAGILQPPMIGGFGRFDGDAGEFFGDEEVAGRRVLCRFRWTRGDAPRWEQAFSDDKGKNWETNWIMTFQRQEAE